MHNRTAASIVAELSAISHGVYANLPSSLQSHPHAIGAHARPGAPKRNGSAAGGDVAGGRRLAQQAAPRQPALPSLHQSPAHPSPAHPSHHHRAGNGSELLDERGLPLFACRDRINPIEHTRHPLQGLHSPSIGVKYESAPHTVHAFDFPALCALHSLPARGSRLAAPCALCRYKNMETAAKYAHALIDAAALFRDRKGPIPSPLFTYNMVHPRLPNSLMRSAATEARLAEDARRDVPGRVCGVTRRPSAGLHAQMER